MRDQFGESWNVRLLSVQEQVATKAQEARDYRPPLIRLIHGSFTASGARQDGTVARVLLEVYDQLTGESLADAAPKPLHDHGQRLRDMDVRLRRTLSRAAEAGRLRIEPVERKPWPLVREQEEDAPPPLSNVPESTTFIGLRLIDTDGKPVPRRAYRITLPDGSVREGLLSSQGTARIDGLSPGTCKIDFLELDRVDFNGITPLPGSRQPGVIGPVIPTTGAAAEQPIENPNQPANPGADADEKAPLLGSFVDQDGNPLQSWPILAFSIGGVVAADLKSASGLTLQNAPGADGRTITDDAGTVTVQAVDPGTDIKVRISTVTTKAALSSAPAPTVDAGQRGTDVTNVPSPKETVVRPPEPTGDWESFIGREVDAAILSDVQKARQREPVEPGVQVKAGKGPDDLVYGGGTTHTKWVLDELDKRIAAASGLEKLQIEAFRKLQGDDKTGSEGTTAAINTWDGMILTYGTGWAGATLLPLVMKRMMENADIAARFHDVGLHWVPVPPKFKSSKVDPLNPGSGTGDYRVVDVENKRVISLSSVPATEFSATTTKQLQYVRTHHELVFLLINVARDEQTRIPVLNAQLDTFKSISATFPHADAIATLAAFRFLCHLKHWFTVAAGDLVTPSTGRRVLPADGGGIPSPDRDKKIVSVAIRALIARMGRERFTRLDQARGYWREMGADGLAVDDPLMTSPAIPRSAIPGHLVLPRQDHPGSFYDAGPTTDYDF